VNVATKPLDAGKSVADHISPQSIKPIDVFVHLSQGQGAEDWERRWRSGELIGINDPTPYGYKRAEDSGCRIRFSQVVANEGKLAKLSRFAVGGLLGFDFVHALRNAKSICSAEIVWTHTERQFLAVALLLCLRSKRARRPKLIGQSVWLIDHWRKQPGLHRILHSWLICHGVDMLTFLSPENLAVAKRLFPKTPSELVLYGIPSEQKNPPALRSVSPVKIIAVGNDRHRDWKAAIAAVRGQSDIELTIVSQTAPRRLMKGVDNVRIITLSSNDELFRLYDDSTLVLVPLKQNMHAGGITVIQEAALRGIPVIASDTGGLRAYFEGEAVCYVRPEDPQAILRAIRTLVDDPSAMLSMAQKAQRRMDEGGLGASSYVARHVELSERLLKRNE